MLEFDHIYEVKNWFRRYEPVDFSDPNEEGYWLGCKDKPNMGDWVLFQHIRQGSYVNGAYEYEISRPILGLCVGHTIWDQALVLQIVEEERAYVGNQKIKLKVYNEDGSLSHKNSLIMSYENQIEFFEFWSDDIRLLGKWKVKPNWKELKKVLNN